MIKYVKFNIPENPIPILYSNTYADYSEYKVVKGLLFLTVNTGKSVINNGY